MDEMTLTEAKEWLRARVVKGERCPCCDQFARVYRRTINRSMAKTLVALCRVGGTHTFVHQRAVERAAARYYDLVGLDTHEISQLSWWVLVEEELISRPDGGRAGWWRATPLGMAWASGKTVVPRYAHLYNGKVLRVDGLPLRIRQVKGFDLRELMDI
jgi:hypothetical protein